MLSARQFPLAAKALKPGRPSEPDEQRVKAVLIDQTRATPGTHSECGRLRLSRGQARLGSTELCGRQTMAGSHKGPTRGFR